MRALSSSRLAVAACVAMVGAASTGCKSTPEGETKLWNSKLASASKWSGRYANLAPAIEQRVAEARGKFEVAQKQTDSDAKLAGMKAANAHLGMIVDPLDRHDRLLREVRRLAGDRDIRSLPSREVDPIVRQASRQARETREMIRQSSPADAVEAVRIVQNAVTRLEAAAKNLRRLRSRARDKRKQERAKSSSRN